MKLRHRFRDLRIRTKLVLLIAILMGGISSFVSIYFPGRQEEREILALAAKARSIADMTAFTVAPALVFGDRRTLEESLEAARQNRDLEYVVTVDDSGRVMGAYNFSGAQKGGYTVADAAGHIPRDQKVYRVISPVSFDRREIGRVYLGLSLADLRADTGRARSGLLGVSILIFIIGTVSVVAIGTVLTEPLRKMVEAARQIALGDLSVRASVTSGDEAGQLAGAFNRMVQTLETTHSEIAEANRSLERRVEKRTRELSQQIADRKDAEEKLRQSEEQFRLISENMADMIALLDIEGRYVYNSPSYRVVLGESGALKGTDAFDAIHPEDRGRIREVFAETVRTGAGQRVEYRYLLPDASVRHIESQASAVRTAGGNVSYVIVVSRDITEKKLLERKFLRAQRMESLGTLASGIAHDLNNVLAPIIMSVDMLRSRLPGKGDQRLLDALESSAKRGAGIVKQVLAFGRGLSWTWWTRRCRSCWRGSGSLSSPNTSFRKSRRSSRRSFRSPSISDRISPGTSGPSRQIPRRCTR